MTIQREKPRRRCVGCGEMKEKRDLIRVVRTPEGTFALDPTGKANGRGAYVCANADCITAAIKRNGLSRSFRCAVDASLLQPLLEQLSEVRTSDV